MSYRRNKKQRRQQEIEFALADGTITMDDVNEAKRIKRDIRNGVLPRYHFAKDKEGDLLSTKLRLMQNTETKETVKMKRGWNVKLESTFKTLTKK
jgi:hypothetical protein